MSATRDDIVGQRLEDLILARVADRGVVDVAGDTARFAPPSIAASAWSERISAARRRMKADRRLDKRDRPTRAAIAAMRGRLGLRGAAPWRRIVDRVIPGIALGVAAGDRRAHARLPGRDAWAAAIVGRATGVWRDGLPPTVAQVCDALVWKQLGLAGVPKRTPAEIRAHVVAQLAPGVGAAGGVERLIRMVAAREVGAPRPDLRGLRDALGRRWLAGVAWGAATGSSASASASASALGSRGDGLAALAGAVKAAASAATAGVFGDRKVFISALWRDLRGRLDGMDLDGFKQKLVAAHRAGLVSLARADLVSVMDPAEVAASETASAEARYHFVVREAPREG